MPHSSTLHRGNDPCIPHLHVVIMAGGGGTRFWPLSTSARPKQFLDVLGLGRTLLQMAYDRARILAAPERIWVITSNEQLALVREQLPELPHERIVGEPCKRNTAPCLALAATLIQREANGQLMLAMPSDHLITDVELFSSIVLSLCHLVEKEDALCAIGVSPTRAETGYGYIEVEHPLARGGISLQPVVAFHEKPDRETAARYLQSGKHAWNTGIFLWPCAYFLRELARLAPAIVSPFARLRFGADAPPLAEQLAPIYEGIDAQSIDYALLEKDTKRYAILSPLQWSDLGTWLSVAQHKEKDNQGNTVSPNVLLRSSSSCMVHVPQGRIAVVQGLEGYAVVQTERALLIAPMGDDAAMRELQQAMREHGLSEYL